MDRNAPLDFRLLKSLRKQLGWTQEELAKRSLLSVRVIAKAEAGRAVANKTAHALATTLQEAGKQVTVADLKCTPESLVRQFLKNYVTYQAECVEHSKSFLSPRIVAFVDGDPTTNPIAGVYRGLAEFAAFFRKFFAIFVRDGGTLGDNPQIRCIGNEVFAWGHEFIRVPEVGPQPAGFVMLRMRFESGLMTYFEDRYEAYGMMGQLDKWAREFPEAGWLNHLNRDALANEGYRRPIQPPEEPTVQ